MSKKKKQTGPQLLVRVIKHCEECPYLKDYTRLKDYVYCSHLLFGCFFHKDKYDLSKMIRPGCRLNEIYKKELESWSKLNDETKKD